MLNIFENHWEMKIKPTMIYHTTPAMMTVIITFEALENKEYWQVCTEIGNFPTWMVGK